MGYRPRPPPRPSPTLRWGGSIGHTHQLPGRIVAVVGGAVGRGDLGEAAEEGRVEAPDVVGQGFEGRQDRVALVVGGDADGAASLVGKGVLGQRVGRVLIVVETDEAAELVVAVDR